MKHVLYTVFLIAATAGCSRVQIVYNQLDWLLPYYVETYVELSEEQDSFLDQEVGKLLAWHCNTQVSAYAELLRSASSDFQNNCITTDSLKDYSNRIDKFWKDILLQASPAISDLLLEANDVQLNELFDGFDERNEEWLAEHLNTIPDKMREDYIKRMRDELERWIGPLQPAQQQALFEWSVRFRPLGMEGLQMRKAWQSRLQNLIRYRDDREAFHAGIHELLGNPETLRTDAYQKLLDNNREHTIELVYRVGVHLNQEQRLHLNHHAESIALAFDKLSCDDV